MCAWKDDFTLFLNKTAVALALSSKSILYVKSEYNITFLSIEKTGRKPCLIREHIIGIVMVSERDFDNVTCVWSYNVYAL